MEYVSFNSNSLVSISLTTTHAIETSDDASPCAPWVLDGTPATLAIDPAIATLACPVFLTPPRSRVAARHPRTPQGPLDPLARQPQDHHPARRPRLSYRRSDPRP